MSENKSILTRISQSFSRPFTKTDIPNATSSRMASKIKAGSIPEPTKQWLYKVANDSLSNSRASLNGKDEAWRTAYYHLASRNLVRDMADESIDRNMVDLKALLVGKLLDSEDRRSLVPDVLPRVRQRVVDAQGSAVGALLGSRLECTAAFVPLDAPTMRARGRLQGTAETDTQTADPASRRQILPLSTELDDIIASVASEVENLRTSANDYFDSASDAMKPLNATQRKELYLKYASDLLATSDTDLDSAVDPDVHALLVHKLLSGPDFTDDIPSDVQTKYEEAMMTDKGIVMKAHVDSIWPLDKPSVMYLSRLGKSADAEMTAAFEQALQKYENQGPSGEAAGALTRLCYEMDYRDESGHNSVAKEWATSDPDEAAERLSGLAGMESLGSEEIASVVSVLKTLADCQKNLEVDTQFPRYMT